MSASFSNRGSSHKPPAVALARRFGLWAAFVGAMLGLAGCGHVRSPEGQSSAASCLAAPSIPNLRVQVITAEHELVTVSLREPGRALDRRALQGLPRGDEIVGMDYRIARGQLFALSKSGQLWTLDPATATLSAVGAPSGAKLQGSRFDVDFTPAFDRLRVISDTGQNLRLHPETGQLVGTDAALVSQQGQAVAIAATAYTYHPRDDKLTTNFVIDLQSGQLMLQGSREGEQPVVSPNTGVLTRIASLGLSGPISQASLDISDRGNVAVAALRVEETGLYLIDLNQGQAQCAGRLLNGSPIRALAIEP